MTLLLSILQYKNVLEKDTNVDICFSMHNINQYLI